MNSASGAATQRVRPIAFVLIWSTGFVAGLLLLRFGLAALGLGAIALAMRAPWPRSPREIDRVASLFYLIAPVSAIMTALALHERLSAVALFGFGVVAAGVALATRANLGSSEPPSAALQILSGPI